MQKRLGSRLALAAALLGAAWMWTAPQQAEATSLAPLTVEQMTDAASLIVQGKVVRIWTTTDDNGLVWTLASIEIGNVIKGSDQPERIVVHNLGGRDDDHNVRVWSAARFSHGEELVVFLDKISEDRWSPVGMFQGKYTVRRAPNDTRQHLVRFNRDPDEPFDHRFLPHPPVEKRLYMDDLMGQVQHRLDVGWDGKPIPGLSSEQLRSINTPEMRRR